jgi:hypothetical protein
MTTTPGPTRPRADRVSRVNGFRGEALIHLLHQTFLTAMKMLPATRICTALCLAALCTVAASAQVQPAPGAAPRAQQPYDGRQGAYGVQPNGGYREGGAQSFPGANANYGRGPVAPPMQPRQYAQQPGPGNPSGAHLGQWMQQHSNLNPQQQQRALQNEPGFNRLPPQMQQRMVERLNRLNSMPPDQRARVIERGEEFERLTPQQRGDVRGAMGQLGSLPPDRRRAVARSFRELREMPVPERNAILNSPQYRQQFSDEERGTIGNLLAVSPLLPPSR